MRIRNDALRTAVTVICYIMGAGISVGLFFLLTGTGIGMDALLSCWIALTTEMLLLYYARFITDSWRKTDSNVGTYQFFLVINVILLFVSALFVIQLQKKTMILNIVHIAATVLFTAINSIVHMLAVKDSNEK